MDGELLGRRRCGKAVVMTVVSFDDVEPGSIAVWCDNALEILGVLREHQEKLPFRIPPETLLLLEDIVAGWSHEAVAGRPPAPRTYGTDELRNLILYWCNITKLTEDERDRLGIRFTPPAGRPFADALARAVGGAMAAQPELTAFAERLEATWQECQPGFAAGRAAGATG